MQLCNVEIGIEEALTLLKMRGVIKENILLLKNKKQAVAAALNGKNVPALLPTALRKSWIYQLLSFIIRSGHFTNWE